jgi:hypothetical protein
MSAAAFQGTFSDFKLIRGRKCAQIVIEVPLEQADAALKSLGGLPNPADERWVTVARLQPEAKATPVESDAEGRKRRFHELNPAAQIAMSCSSPSFREFLRDRKSGFLPDDKDACDKWVKGYLGVENKTEVVPGSEAFALWSEMRGEFDFWLKYERSAA